MARHSGRRGAWELSLRMLAYGRPRTMSAACSTGTDYERIRERRVSGPGRHCPRGRFWPSNGIARGGGPIGIGWSSCASRDARVCWILRPRSSGMREPILDV